LTFVSLLWLEDSASDSLTRYFLGCGATPQPHFDGRVLGDVYIGDRCTLFLELETWYQ